MITREKMAEKLDLMAAIEISSQKGGVKVYALYTEEEFKKFREMEKTPDAATSEVKEEEFAASMDDLRNLLLPDIVTPADEEVKEGETI